jgi:UPF0716 protein FxsA
VAVWLVLEIWLLTVIAGAAGGWAVFLLLVAGAVCGATVIRRTGRRVFRNLSRSFQSGQRGGPVPDEQRGGSSLVILGGVLLIIPGPVSDVLGLLLLLAPVRRVASRFVERAVERRMPAAVPGTWTDAFQQARRRRPDGKVVPGEVVHEDEPPTREDGSSGSGPRPPLTP